MITPYVEFTLVTIHLEVWPSQRDSYFDHNHPQVNVVKYVPILSVINESIEGFIFDDFGCFLSWVSTAFNLGFPFVKQAPRVTPTCEK